jgi:hypothetical protein
MELRKRPNAPQAKPPKDGLFSVYDPETGALIRTETYSNWVLHSTKDQPSVVRYGPGRKVLGREWHTAGELDRGNDLPAVLEDDGKGNTRTAYYKAGEQHRDAGPTEIQTFADGTRNTEWIRHGVPYQPSLVEESLFDKDGQRIPETTLAKDLAHPLGADIATATAAMTAEDAKSAASKQLAFTPGERPPMMSLVEKMKAGPPREDGEPGRAYDSKYETAVEAHSHKMGKGYKYHRLDGPAFKTWNGKTGMQTEEWHKNGAWHREDGPAVIEPDPKNPGHLRERWFRDGKPYNPTGAEREVWDEKKRKQGGPFYVEPTAPDIGTADFKALAAKQKKKDDAEKDQKKHAIKQAAKAAQEKAGRGIDKTVQGAKYILSLADELSR